LFFYLQVGTALDYLHKDRYVVHCDIKPSNILVFTFPEAGHSCFDQYFDTVMCRLCQSKEESPGVLVKLADLGTACFIGPEGFSKRPNIPGHNAPEDILYLEKELLTEKVATLVSITYLHSKLLGVTDYTVQFVLTHY